jgi:predicted DCC family thiol-disulfide oxidoreductase YuxK
MKIIFFDGYCSLCNGFVDWGLKHDKHQVIQYASLQSRTASQYILDSNLISNPQTVIYFREGRFFYESDAILYFLKDLKTIWSFLFYLRFIPSFIRNSVYNFIASHRYTFFKKSETCRLPTTAEKNRILD